MCSHNHVKPSKATRDIAGLQFTYSTKKCIDCGSTLWNQKIEEKFQDWLGEQCRINPEKFVIQKVQISDELVGFAAELAKENHSSESAVFQVCLSFYFILAAKRPELLTKIDGIQPSSKSLTLKKFRVSPKLFVKIEANAKLFSLNMNEIASWVIQRVLLAARENIEATREELEFALAA